MLMSNIFHQLQVLRISLNSDDDYLDSDRWEDLICNSLPCLNTFDLQYFGKLFDEDEYYWLNDEFNSPFWIEHKWYFDHQYYRYKNAFYVYFYSIKKCFHPKKFL